jgi:hypothetical protein
MEMIRKSIFGLKNKKIQMTASLIQKFLLMLAIFSMLSAIAQAGTIQPFLTQDVTHYTNIEINGESFALKNYFNGTDSWGFEKESGVIINPYGYTGPEYLGGPDENGNTHPTYYLGTFEKVNNNSGGGDSPAVIRDLITRFLGEDITFWGYTKSDGDGMTSEGYSLIVTSPIVDENDQRIDGTWEVKNQDENNETINFYSVAGGRGFALYWVNPEQSSGSWTTKHLRNSPGNIPTLSHFSVMKTSSIPPGGTDPVPEPATMLLFGFSLIGLAGVARRKNNKF